MTKGMMAQIEINMLDKEKMDEFAAKLKEVISEFTGGTPEEKKPAGE